MTARPLVAAATLWLVLAGCGADAGSAREPLSNIPEPERSEFLGGLDAALPLARTCAGSVGCFMELARPYGPLHLTVGTKFGSENPGAANHLQNFAFGALGGAAGADPQEIANDFHCGPPCAERRKGELLTDLPIARWIALTFPTAANEVIALWPDDAVRVDDRVFAGRSHGLRRTPVLGMAVPDAPVSGGTVPPVASVIADTLRGTAATAVVRDEFGGVRLVHRESVGDNEAGLLFASEAQAAAIDDRQLPSGGRYVLIAPVEAGVYFYIRT